MGQICYFQPVTLLIVSVSDVCPPDHDCARDSGLCTPALGAAGCPLHLQLHVLVQVRGRRHPGYPFHHPQVAGQRQRHQLRWRSVLQTSR